MSVWLLKLAHADTRQPAPGIPVTLLDDAGNPGGYWVSDAQGVVTIPRTDAKQVTLRVGLRSEDPITLGTDRLGREIVELEAPRSLVPTTTSAAPPAVRGRTITPDRDVPGHVLHFVRLAMAPAGRRRLPATAGDEAAPGEFLEVQDPQNTDLRYGALIDVEQYWQPLGQVGGELLYSLALGAGDAARVAIQDQRFPEGRRPLDALAAQIAGDGMNPAGDPVLDTLSLDDGPLDAGLAHAAAETMQWLNDRAVRASEALRRRPISLLELGDAPAPAGSAVRTVRAQDAPASYHFYEPLARYRVTARAARLRPAVLVPFRLPNLATRAVVRQFGHILRRSLLDATLRPEIDKMLGTIPPAPHESTSPPVSELRLVIHRAPAEHAPDLRQIWCFLHVDNARYTVHFFPADPPPAGVQSAAAPLAQHWIGAIRLADFHQRPLVYPGRVSLQNGSASMLAFSAVHIEGRVGESWVRLHSVRDLVLPAQAQVRLASLATLTAAPGVDPGEGRLFAHLAAHLPYYAGALIAGGDAGARYLALSRVLDDSGRPVAELVENQVAAVVGNYLAFPLRSAATAPQALREALRRYAERSSRGVEEITVTVPVPGVWMSRQEEAVRIESDGEASPPVPLSAMRRGGAR